MAKVFNCRDLGNDCDVVIRGKNEQQVMVRAIEHGRKTHNMKELQGDLPRDFVDNMEAAIRDG